MTLNKKVMSGLMGGAALAILAACGGQTPTTTAETTQCVDLNDGTYFVVEDGKLVATTQPEAEIVEIAAPIGWTDALENTFPGLGFPWMGLNVRENVATLTGLAPNVAAKERAFQAGEAAINAHPDGKDQITLVVDGISVEGGEAGVGEALADLSDQALSLEACQTAFDGTMQGRFVQFQTSRAEISSVSARLLDAVTGVAILCKDYSVEIGGHTDSRGSDEYNLNLSQRRSDAVKAYLVQRGVPSDFLVAVGYGETKPLDEALTLEAYKKNRRTEFTVTERN